MSKDILFHTIFVHETSKTWVVFVHGAGGSSAIWFRQLKAYKKEYNVLLLDLRGHGKSNDLLQNFVDNNYSFIITISPAHTLLVFHWAQFLFEILQKSPRNMFLAWC